MNKEDNSPALDEDQIFEYVKKEVLPRYQQIFNDKFKSAAFLMKLLEKNLVENSLKTNPEEKFKVHEVITKFMKNFKMFTSSLDENHQKHAASLIYYVRSQIHKKQKNYIRCVEDLGIAIDHFFDCQYYRQRASINFNILKNYKEAFNDFTVVHETTKEKNDKNGELHSVFNISKCLLGMTETEKCLKLVDDYIRKVFKFQSEKDVDVVEEEEEGEESEEEAGATAEELLRKNYQIWNNEMKDQNDSFWGYFSIFLLLRAECHLRMNLFEKTKSEWNFLMESFIRFFRVKNVVGNMCFCRDLDRKFEEFTSYRLFFMEYILRLTSLQPDASPKKMTKKARTAQRNKNVGTLRKIDPQKVHFSDSEINKLRKRVDYEDEMIEKLEKKKKEQYPVDPYAITKQLLLLKNAMPDQVMGGTDLAQRMLNVLSQVALEDLVWTNPTLKYWSCNVLDFKEPLIIPKGSQISGNFSQKGFYDPGRGRSILPLDYYRYMPIPTDAKVREVFHIHPPTDSSLRSFLEGSIHLRKTPSSKFGSRKDEIVYLAQKVMQVMQGNVHEMMNLYRLPIKRLQEKYPSLHQCDLLLILCHQKLQDLITKIKKNLILTFDDLVKHKVPGVCRHRAILFKLCCDLRNIPSRLVRGYLTFFDQTKDTKQPQRISHAWNLIKIEGKVYIVDLMNGTEILIDWCSNEAEIYRSHGGFRYPRDEEGGGVGQPNKPFAEQIASVPLSVPLMFSPTDGFRNTLQSCDVSKPLWEKNSLFSKTSKLVSKTDNLEEHVIHKQVDIKLINDYFEAMVKENRMKKGKREYFMSQKKFLIRYLNHKNLVSGQYDSVYEDKYFLFFKYYESNAVEYLEKIRSSASKNKKSLERRTRNIDVLIFLINVLKGLRFLHKNGIYHNNLKLSNVLINFGKKNEKKKKNGLIEEVKISDFFGINSFQTYLVLWELTKKKQVKIVKDYIVKNQLIHIPPEIVEYGSKKKSLNQEEFRKLFFENEKFDIFSFGVILKHFKDFLPQTLSSVCNTCVSRYRNSRPKISTILRKLEGAVLKEFHKIGGIEKIHEGRKLELKKILDEMIVGRQNLEMAERKLEETKEAAIKVTNELKSDIEKKNQKCLSFAERLKELEKTNHVLEEKLLIKNNIGNVGVGVGGDDASKRLEEIIEKKVAERLEEEMKGYGMAVRLYREGMEEKMKDLRKQKDEEVLGLMKQVEELLQNQKKKE